MAGGCGRVEARSSRRFRFIEGRVWVVLRWNGDESCGLALTGWVVELGLPYSHWAVWWNCESDV